MVFFACLIQTIFSVIINIFGKSDLDYKFNSTFLNWLVISIGQMLVRLYPLILKISNEQKPNVKITLKKKFLHYFFLCLIVASMVFIEYLSDFFIRRNIEKTDNLFPSNNPIIICFEMIFLICISKWILKYKYFKHHIISLIAFILIGLAFFLFNYINSPIKKLYLVFILRIVQAVLDAIYRCYQKYMMEKLYYPYWNIAFVPGVFLFPIALVLFIIQLVFYTENDIKKNLTNFIIFKIVLPLILNVIMSPLTILIVYYFPPDYILIISLLSSIVRTLTFCIRYLKFRYVSIPLHIIQIFVMLVYLEILELNFCGLNENTRRNIHLRSETDSSFNQRETVSSDNNTETVINHSIELVEKINEDIKTEEEN